MLHDREDSGASAKNMVRLRPRHDAIMCACLLAHAGAPSVRFLHHAGLRDSSMAHAELADVMLMTPEEFLVYPLEDMKAELVRGELRVREHRWCGWWIRLSAR